MPSTIRAKGKDRPQVRGPGNLFLMLPADRQSDGKGCSSSDIVSKRDRSAVFYDDNIVAGRQPRTGSRANRFRGEEGVENMILYRLGDTASMVRDRDVDKFIGLMVSVVRGPAAPSP